MKVSRSGRGGVALLLGLLAAVALLAWLSERSRITRELARSTRSQAVPGRALGRGDIAEILQSLGVLHPIPIAPERQARLAPESTNASRPQLYSSVHPPRRERRTAFALTPRIFKLGAPTLSLLMADAELAELAANPEQRGRAWERPGYLGYFQNRRLRFASGVGVRVHGGGARDRAQFSYRLYFRRRYGFERFEADVFSGRRRPPSEVIVRVADGRDRAGHPWRFLNAMPMDIARRIGVPAPATHPVLFVLNGKRQGVYALTEYIHRDFIETRFGLDDFVLVRTKVNRDERRRGKQPVREGDPAKYEELLTWLESGGNLDRDQLAERVDLDNLSRWFLAILYCSTRDPYQGGLVLDLSTPGARWFWIAWDMDISFGLNAGRRDWVTLGGLRGQQDPRAKILNRLLRDESYRRELASLFDRVMNHRLSDDFLASFIDRYRELARSFELDDTTFLDKIEAWCKRREGELRADFERRLGSGPTRALVVAADGGRKLEIDGFEPRLPYRGSYFATNSATLRVGDADAPEFLHWLVDGEVRGAEAELELDMAADHRVRAVFR